jgi:hypothetical protein
MFARLLEEFAPIDWVALGIVFAGWLAYGHRVDGKSLSASKSRARSG